MLTHAVKYLLIPALALLGACLPVRAAEQTFSIRPHWHAGQQSTYKFTKHETQKIAMSIGAKSKSFNVSTDTSGEMTLKVDHVASDGTATITLSRKWMAMTLTGPKGQKKVNDTRSGTSDIPPLYNMLKAFTDNPLKMDIGPDGSVSNIVGVDAIAQQLKAKNDADLRNQIAQFVHQYLLVNQAPPTVHDGTTWTYQHTQPERLGSLDIRVNYAVKSHNRVADVPIANIQATGNMQLNFDASKLPANAPPLQVNLNQDQYKSQIIYDLSRHEIVGLNISQRKQITTTGQIGNRQLQKSTTITTDGQLLRIAEK